MKFKVLKKAAALCICAVIVCAGIATVFAAGKTYSVPEVANMQITLPDDMTAVTRSSDPNDKYFSLFGIDYNTNKQNFENGNIYLQGMTSSSSLTLTVTMTETEESKQLVNYNLLEGDKINEIAKNFISQREYTSCTIDQAANKIVWLEFNTRVTNGGSNIEAYQANTVYDGKSINVTLQRNGGNVTEEDYQIFSSIVSSVEFNKAFFANPIMPYILIGGGVLLIVIIVLIIVIVKVAGRRRKKSKNDKILEELAGKYTSNGSGRSYSDNSDVQPAAEVDIAPAHESKDYELDNFDTDVEKSVSADDAERKYSDADIDAMLGEGGEQSNFTQALPRNEEEPEKEKDDTIDDLDSVSEFFEDGPEQQEVAESPAEPEQAEPAVEQDVPELTVLPVAPTTRKFDFPKENQPEEVSNDVEETEQPEPEEAVEPETEAGFEDDELEEAVEPETEAGFEDDEPVEAVEPETEAGFEDDEPEETAEPEPEEDFEVYEPDEEDDEKPKKGTDLKDEIRKALLNFDSDDENEDEEYNNDEVLVREEAKRTKFRDSNDYFEEAPKKVIGVISSKEIRDAEEYDVIGEMERRADEFEKEPPQKGEAVKDSFKKAGGGVKSFFTHCGYFATNVRRELKRRKAEKKRLQYEEDRKRRARERAERQRQQAENGGLVQVHKRTDRKPESQQRRPSSQQRRPSSQQRRSNTQTRRPSSQNRKGRPPRNI